MAGRFRFDRFLLDAGDRKLTRDGAPVELNARYLDALALLVSEAGRLVSKDRFLDEVWRGVPVTDEALTQCIRTLRRQLGDDAGNPRFIETVPKHGYRFIAAVETAGLDAAPSAAAQAAPEAAALPSNRRDEFLAVGRAGMLGGGVAGLLGGLFYGFAGASGAGAGAVSALLVLVCITVALALVGAIGVAFGIAGSALATGGIGPASILGGAAGGLVVGAVVKLVGLDAFNLLLGQSPGDITGALEGALLGGAVGFGAWLASRGGNAGAVRRGAAIAGLAGGAAGALIPATGGHLLGGSLSLLASQFPNSRLGLDQIGALFGEAGYGPISESVTSALEGALFGACVVGAIVIARRGPRPRRGAAASAG